MNEHALRIFIWAIMSALSSGGFWLAYRSQIKRDFLMLLSAQERYHQAGGLKNSLNAAIGFKAETSSDLQDAKDHLEKSKAVLDRDIRQRRNCMLVCPALMAIIVLLAL